MNSVVTNKRYHRQVLLKEFGQSSQDKLSLAKVLVIGAGGLGCPALQYLTAAGVGAIGIVDHDEVDISNLHRQLLYTVEDVGKSKAETAAIKLKLLNPEVGLTVYNFQINTLNALEIISDYDIIIDGSDNYATRYLINDACFLLKKPLVYGAVLRFEGQVGVFNLVDEMTGILTNYRDLFPQPPDAASNLSCNEAGVLGVLPGIIGTMQATEAIKIITGIGKPLCNKIVTYNALENTFFDFHISPREMSNGLLPKDIGSYKTYNYDWFCNPIRDSEITVEVFNALLLQKEVSIIDVRERDEMPVVDEFTFTNIPLSIFDKTISTFTPQHKVVLFCQSGKRSLMALKIMQEKHPKSSIYSLKNGIAAWKAHQKNTRHE